jgi:hypothetical protein
VSSVARVAAVKTVAAVDIDELVSLRTGGEVPSDCETWSWGMALGWTCFSGLADKCDTGRGWSLSLGGASAKLGAGCIL